MLVVEQPLDAATITRAGCMDILVSLMMNPAGVSDQNSVIELVRLSLLTYAWATREEFSLRISRTLGEDKVIGHEMVQQMINTSRTERVQHATRLANYAAFHSVQPNADTPPTKN